jgi:hypothetical protein
MDRHDIEKNDDGSANDYPSNWKYHGEAEGRIDLAPLYDEYKDVDFSYAQHPSSSAPPTPYW